MVQRPGCFSLIQRINLIAWVLTRFALTPDAWSYLAAVCLYFRQTAAKYDQASGVKANQARTDAMILMRWIEEKIKETVPAASLVEFCRPRALSSWIEENIKKLKRTRSDIIDLTDSLYEEKDEKKPRWTRSDPLVGSAEKDQEKPSWTRSDFIDVTDSLYDDDNYYSESAGY